MNDSPRPTPGEASALVIEVPEAEPLVGEWRRAYDPVSKYGMPAHVTVLYPFREPHAIDPGTLERLLDTIGDHRPFTATFSSVGTFPDGVLYLAPDPPEPFVALTESVAAAFPEHPPYGGTFAEPIPHLTVASGLAEAQRDQLAGVVGPAIEGGPVTSQITAVSLFTRGLDGRWVHRTAIPLGTDPSLG